MGVSMETATPTIHQEKDVPTQPHLYFLSGLSGTMASGETMIPELEKAMQDASSKVPEESQVTYLHSIASGEETNTDPDSPENRFIKYSREILERLKNGQETVVVAHSFGAQELDRLFDELDTSEEFHKHIDKLTIILMAPYGLIKEAKEATKLLRFIEIARAQMPFGPFNSFRQGLETLAYLPPAEISEEAIEQLVESLFANKSQYPNTTADDEITSFRTIRHDEGSFTELPAEQQTEIKASVSSIDSKLKKAMEAKNWFVCKYLLRRRGKKLRKHLEAAYASSMTPDMYTTMAQANLGVAGLYDRVLKGKAYERMETYSQKNKYDKKPTIKAIVPEYDVIYSLEELQQMLGLSEEEVNESIAILTATTHNSMALNARGLGEAVAHLTKSSITAKNQARQS